METRRRNRETSCCCCCCCFMVALFLLRAGTSLVTQGSPLTIRMYQSQSADHCCCFSLQHQTDIHLDVFLFLHRAQSLGLVYYSNSSLLVATHSTLLVFQNTDKRAGSLLALNASTVLQSTGHKLSLVSVFQCQVCLRRYLPVFSPAIASPQHCPPHATKIHCFASKLSCNLMLATWRPQLQVFYSHW